MMRAMSSGVAGLKAHQTALDVIGNNIANVNTYGFKASRTTFSDVLYQTLQDATAPSTTNEGGKNPSQVGYGATASSVQVNTGRAGMTTTGYSTDCYINGEGYFVVATGDNGSGTPTGIKYTRVGELTFNSAGYLVDGNGNCVLSATGTGASATYSYIKYDPTSVTYKDIAIASDGSITGTDSSGAVQTIGQIALAHFANPGGLTQEGDSYYNSSVNSGDPTYENPGASVTGALVTGALESSNVDLANEFANMITTERGYQANSKIITVADTMLETLVNMVR